MACKKEKLFEIHITLNVKTENLPCIRTRKNARIKLKTNHILRKLCFREKKWFVRMEG
jgi:hypothetical protein